MMGLLRYGLSMVKRNYLRQHKDTSGKEEKVGTKYGWMMMMMMKIYDGKINYSYH